MSAGGPPDQTERLKKALVAIKTLQARVEALELEKNEPIAVTGLACRFPGHANDPAAFWRLLRDGVDGITEVPKSRWDIDAYYDADPDAPGKSYARHGGFIDAIDEFDPHFFGISPREARSIDPQHRLILEVAWEALEDASQFPGELQGTATGVFVGITTNDYADVLSAGGSEYLDAYQLTGCSLNFVAGRLAHVLGLHGPAMAIDTACSSSLVAVHLACQSLRAGECDMALAGGVNALLQPDTFISASKARMLSADGRCKTFDERANGFVRGEGCGVVVLRRLSDARKRGDRILAIVRGSAVNQDGPSSGLTVPNKLAQESLIRRALAVAKIDPSHIGYVEAHGTGTPLGDPIELRALAGVLGEGRPSNEPFLLGSVKTNIGHLESAAGIAGFIKAVLSLVHEAVPPHLHFTTPTPHVTWSAIPARIPTQLTPWTRSDRPRLASVSSFGASGTNAHVVLEEGPALETAEKPSSRPVHLLTLSARTPGALRSYAARFERYLSSASDSLAEIAYTMNTRRTPFAERLAIVATSGADATAALAAFASGEASPAVVSTSTDRSTPRKVAFLFTGQGSQYLGMGRTLYQTEPVFRDALDRCDAILRPVLDRPLLDVIFGNGEANAGLLDRTDYTQPALFAIEWALAELWESWGVRPTAVLGHSVGEYAAACRAGLFSLEDGLALIARRARLMADLPAGGDMAAIFAPESRVADLIAGVPGVSIAALNGPENTVVSGPSAGIAEVLRQYDSQGIRSRRLVVSHAFHSALLDPMLEQLESAASRLQFHELTVAMVSNLTGKRATRNELSRGAYWRQHARMPVRFAQGVESLRELGCDIFIEIGPAPVLLGMAARCIPEGAVFLPTLRQGADDSVTACRTLATLWANHVPVDWARFHDDAKRRAVFVPAGPFERQRLWIDPAPVSRRRMASVPAGAHPLLSAPIRTAATSDTVFESELVPSALAWLDGHRINGVAIVPATAFVDAMLSAARAQHGALVNQLSDLALREACAVPDDSARVFQVVVGPMRDGECTVRAFSASLDDGQSESSWTLHASATARAATARREGAAKLDDLRSRVATPMDIKAHYERLAGAGLTLGAPFRGITGLWRTSDAALARIEPAAAEPNAVLIDPAMLDACFQTAAPLVFERTAGSMVVPAGVARCRIDSTVRGPLWSYAVVRNLTPESATLDISVFNDEGQLVGEIEQLSLRTVRASAFGKRDETSPFYRVEWEPRESTAVRLAWSPTVADVSQRIDDAVDIDDAAFGVRAFDEHLPELNALATGYMLDALVHLGWRPQPGDIVSTDALGDRLGVIPAHRRFLHRILSMLAEDGLLTAQGGGWRVEIAVGPSDVDRLEARLTTFANCAPELGMMTRVGRHLATALRGGCDVVDLLFPKGSLEFAERLYEDSALFGPYNAAIKEAVVAAVARVPAGQRARILEIGAGTGATAARILPHLPAAAAEYTFTDVSSLFLAKAQEKFAAYPFVNYKLLDIERDPSSQGFADGDFDVIVAANVLHATSDLRETLRHARRLLAPGGLLVLLEGAQALRLGDLIVGLTDGWWRFRDHDLRPAHALLAPDRWLTALNEVGFAESATWPAPPPARGALSFHMAVVARTPEVEASSSGADAAGGARPWVVLADAGGLGARVAESLTSRGVAVVTVRAANRFAAVGPAEFEIDPSVPDHFVELLRSVRADGGVCAGVVDCWSLDVNRDADSAVGLQLGTGSALHAVQALAREGAASSAFWVVTRDAQTVAGIGRPVNALQASVWGLANTIAREYPELRCGRVDLDWPPTADEAELVSREVLARPEDDQIAYRGGSRYVARLVSAPAPGRVPAGDERETPEQLFVETPGNIDGIGFRTVARRTPGPGEVEIRVEAAGVNFRDVLRALGLYPGDTGDALGVECAGRIVSLGAGVRDRRVGERVIALADGAFGTFVTAPAPLVLTLPHAFSPSEGATIPSAFGTAWYGLVTLAHVREGERVLIHAAAGGVGLAAVQVAQRLGAEVFATAGSARKRDLLRSMGVTHVFDSRSISFAADLRSVAPDGVDVVLNSLSGDFIAASVDVLRPAGRFVELGRRDILTNEQFLAARPAGAYFIVNLAETCRREPARAGVLLQEVMAEFEAGRLRPLPITAFASDAVKEAFRHMAQARHVGKIVVTRPAQAWPLDPRASYLITGGLAGVGLLVADWMVGHGARHVVLMARSAPSAEALAAIASMEARGATVVLSRGDVSVIDDVRTALSVVPEGIPLRGVMHCAGVLDDGVVSQLNRDRLATVMAPKVAGSWNLHTLTGSMPLDFFMLFSSAVSLLGSLGQGNHAAACAYQDALAWDRAANGLTASSINWGPWSDVGSVVRQKVGERLKTKGLTPFGPQEGLDLLEAVLRQPLPQVAVIRADWKAYLGDAVGSRQAKVFERLTSRGGEQESAASPEPQEDLVSVLRKSAPAEARRLLDSRVRQQLAKVLGLGSAFRLEPQHGLRDLGIDSLMSLELRNRLQAMIGRPLPSTLAFDYPTVEALTTFLAKEILDVDASGSTETSAAGGGRETQVAEISALSQDEAEALLLAELSQIEEGRTR
jgi:acyl transferase domain-containing protein/acyl carrier protein/protein-L-isoaspartate O-methyltransferase